MALPRAAAPRCGAGSAPRPAPGRPRDPGPGRQPPSGRAAAPPPRRGFPLFRQEGCVCGGGGSPRLGRAAEWEGTGIRAGKDAEGAGGPLVPLLSPIAPNRPPPPPPQRTHTPQPQTGRAPGCFPRALAAPGAALGSRAGAGGAGKQGAAGGSGHPPLRPRRQRPGSPLPPLQLRRSGAEARRGRAGV